MSKFLYFQDGHVKGKNSINRLGNYFEDWLVKFDELLLIAKENKVEAILDGGDLLDSPEPSYRILDEIADRVEKTKIPIYSLFGNHAQRYQSNEHSKYTGLAHLQKRSEYFKYLTTISGKDFRIETVEYKYNIEEKLKEGLYFVGDRNKFWYIAIIHAFVCPKKFPYATHVVCDDIKTDAHVILVAHYHSQWEKKVGNTLFKDIGCFGRNSITEANIKPTVLILDTDKRSIEEIKLKSAKKAEEIFDLEKVNEIKENDKDLEQFIKSLESADFQSTNIKDIVTEISKENNINKNVTDLILQKMEE